jgi:hypothetical protein
VVNHSSPRRLTLTPRAGESDFCNWTDPYHRQPDGERIHSIYGVANPDKLNGIARMIGTEALSRSRQTDSSCG